MNSSESVNYAYVTMLRKCTSICRARKKRMQRLNGRMKMQHSMAAWDYEFFARSMSPYHRTANQVKLEKLTTISGATCSIMAETRMRIEILRYWESSMQFSFCPKFELRRFSSMVDGNAHVRFPVREFFEKLSLHLSGRMGNWQKLETTQFNRSTHR